MKPEEKLQLEKLMAWKESLEKASSIPLQVDQSFRKRFNIPIVVKRILDFPNVGPGGSATLTVDFPKAEIGDLVLVTPPAGSISGTLGGLFMGYVSGTGVVSVKFFNPDTGTSLNPGSGTFTLAIVKP